MGNEEVFNEENPYIYGQFKSEPQKPGETKILRTPKTQNTNLLKSNIINCQTQLDCLEYHLKRRSNDNFLGTREYFPNEKKYGEYKWKSYTEIYKLSQYFLYGIEKLNLCPDIFVDDEIIGKNNYKFLGFYSVNREEWIVACFACQMNSIIITPLYDTLGINSIGFILEQTELETIIMEPKNIKKIIQMKEKNLLHNLKNIILLHSYDEDPKTLEENIQKLKSINLSIYHYENIIEKGKNCIKENENNIIQKKYKHAKPDSVYMICYTSGTSGNPKGAIIKQRSMCLAPHTMFTIGYIITEKDRVISFLPLAHIMEQLIFTGSMIYGTQTGFSSGSVSRLVEDLQKLKPTYLLAVPRILERVYKGIMEKVNKLNPFMQTMFEKAIEIKINNYKKYGILTHSLFDLLFFNKIKNILGGELNWMLSGGAPMQTEIVDRLKVMMCCPIIQGYGQTENCGGSLLCCIKDTTNISTGGLHDGNELKLVDLPEFGYYSNDINKDTGSLEPKGEICLRGDTIFAGYFKNKEETKKVLDDDGWFHTGDVGVIYTDKGNSINIIDRAKSLFKLSQGEYIAPEKVQNVLSNSKYINQIFLYGDSLYSYAIALIYPNKEECVKFVGNEDIWDNKMLINEIIKDCDIIGKENDLKGFELPKKILLIKEPFTQDNNMLTPTLKLKSNVIKKNYENEIKSLYKV